MQLHKSSDRILANPPLLSPGGHARQAPARAPYLHVPVHNGDGGVGSAAYAVRIRKSRRKKGVSGLTSERRGRRTGTARGDRRAPWAGLPGEGFLQGPAKILFPEVTPSGPGPRSKRGAGAIAPAPSLSRLARGGLGGSSGLGQAVTGTDADPQFPLP